MQPINFATNQLFEDYPICNDVFRVNEITTQHIVKMTPIQIVNTFIAADMYCILSHPHQAWQLDGNFPAQNPCDLYNSMKRLETHH
jgi:hypothetical protein